MAAKDPELFLWLDMEMTGLDVEKERPIEVAAIVTDLKFNELGTYHSVIFQPQSLLNRMDEWNQSHHRASGLLSQIPAGKAMDQVDTELADFVSQHFHGEPAVLCGNSIGQDKIFIDKYFLKTAKLMHYRTLDVTAWKLVFQSIYKQKFEKAERHRALGDIKESIGELKFYLNFVKVPN